MRLISVFNAFAPGFCTSVLYLLFQFKEIGRSGTHKDKNYLKKHLSKSTSGFGDNQVHFSQINGIIEPFMIMDS